MDKRLKYDELVNFIKDLCIEIAIKVPITNLDGERAQAFRMIIIKMRNLESKNK